MTIDTLLTLLNVVWGLFLTGIGIEMVNNPPGNDAKKKWAYRILFGLLGVAVVVTTLLQSSRTAREQTAERTQHGIEQGNLEGKLDLVSDVLKKSSCPSTAEIGAAVQQELAKQRYQKVRSPISQGRLGDLSSELLVSMTPSVTRYMKRFRLSGWYTEDHEMELKSYEDYQYDMWNKTLPPLPGGPRYSVGKTQSEWQEIRRKTDDTYRAQLVQLLSDANALRQALINKLPKEAQTPEDDDEVALFAKALSDGSAVQSGLACCPPSIEKAADYLDALAQRVSLIKTLKH